MKPFCFRRRGNSPPLRLLMSAFSAQLCPLARWATFIPFAGYSATPRIWRLGQGFGEAGGGALRLCRLPRHPGLPTREFGWPWPTLAPGGPVGLKARELPRQTDVPRSSSPTGRPGAEGAIGQTGFQGDNYYRPVTFSVPSLGNVPCQTYRTPRPRRTACPPGRARGIFALEPWKASLWEEQRFR